MRLLNIDRVWITINETFSRLGKFFRCTGICLSSPLTLLTNRRRNDGSRIPPAGLISIMNSVLVPHSQSLPIPKKQKKAKHVWAHPCLYRYCKSEKEKKPSLSCYCPGPHSNLPKATVTSISLSPLNREVLHYMTVTHHVACENLDSSEDK